MISVQGKERAPKETAFRALRVKTQSFKNEIRLDPLSPYTFKFQRVDSQRLVPNIEYMYSKYGERKFFTPISINMCHRKKQKTESSAEHVFSKECRVNESTNPTNTHPMQKTFLGAM